MNKVVMTIIMTIILAVGLIAAKFWILPFVILAAGLFILWLWMLIDCLKRPDNWFAKVKIRGNMNNKAERMIAILATLFVVFSAGCISKEVQGTEIVGDVGYSVGYASENKTNLQKIHWTVSIVNKGVKKAEDVRVDVILHHAVVSRLVAFNESTLLLGDLKPDVWKGFRGNATFDSTGLSKQDISGGYPLVKIKITWTEDGRVIEKILPETEIVAKSRKNRYTQTLNQEHLNIVLQVFSLIFSDFQSPTVIYYFFEFALLILIIILRRTYIYNN